MRIKRVQTVFWAVFLLPLNYLAGQLPQETNTRFFTAVCQAEGRIPFSTLNVTPPFWQPVCDAGIQWDNTAKRLDLNLAQGSVLFINANGQAEQDNADFFWDAATDKFGLGTATPDAGFHLVGDGLCVEAADTGCSPASGVGSFEKVGIGTSSPTTALGIEDSTAGATAAPFIDLFRNRGTPSTGNMGAIRFPGEDDASNKTTFAQMTGKAIDITDGSEDGGVVVAVVSGGGLVLSGSMEATGWNGNVVGALTGNADTATDLAADPTDCPAGEFSNAIAASGNLTCSADGSSLTGLIADTAAALAANGANCLGGQLFVEGGVDAAGAAEGCDANLTFQSSVLRADGTNIQLLLEESVSEFLRIGVEESSGDMVIGWDDSTTDDLHFGLFANPTDTSIESLFIMGGDGTFTVDAANKDFHVDDTEVRIGLEDRVNVRLAVQDSVGILDADSINTTFLNMSAISTKTIIQSGSIGTAADQDFEILTNARGTDRIFTFDTAGLFTSDDMATGSMDFDDALNSIKHDGTTRIDLVGAGGGLAVHGDFSPGDSSDALGRDIIVGNSWGDIFVSLPTSSETATVCWISGSNRLVQCNSPPEEFKENWRDLSIDPRDLLGLTIREFDYVRDDQGRDFVRTNLKGFGYSAQRLAKLGIPGLISPDGNSVNKSVLIPLLIELLKDQDRRIAKLEARR